MALQRALRRFAEAEEEDAVDSSMSDSLWYQGIQALAEREVAEEAALAGLAPDPLRVLARVAVEVQDTERRVSSRRAANSALRAPSSSQASMHRMRGRVSGRGRGR